MSSGPGRRRRAPRLLVLSRLLGSVSVVVLLVLILFLASAVYSAAELARSGAWTTQLAPEFGSNDSLDVRGSFSVDNSGLYPVDGLDLSVRVLNGSGVFVGATTATGAHLSAARTTVVPLSLAVPIRASDAGTSLLVRDQTVELALWANATYAYLFPVSLHADQNRSWGAPFEGFAVRVGAPTLENGSTVVRVTVSYTNDAAYPESGALVLSVVGSNGTACGGTTFPVDAPAGTAYSRSETLSLASGCAEAGGTVVTRYTAPGGTVPLPTEPIP